MSATKPRRAKTPWLHGYGPTAKPRRHMSDTQLAMLDVRAGHPLTSPDTLRYLRSITPAGGAR